MKKYVPLCYCLLLSFLMITICSSCSFLFATNDWADANCLFTVGRSMACGRVLYQGIMDHKGLYIYVIYMLGYLISRHSFFGVYLLEILFFFVFLYISYRTLCIYLNRRTAIYLLSLMAAAVTAGESFGAGGGSAEEFVLPMAAGTVYYMLRYVHSGCDRSRMGLKVMLISGCLAGIVFWIKFSMLGLWFGFMAATFVLMLSKKQAGQAFASCMVFLGGMLAASVPAVLYFAVNGALEDCLEIYIYHNLFRYPFIGSDPARHLHTMCSYWLRHGLRNFPLTVFVCGGLAWMVFFMPVGNSVSSQAAREKVFGRLALPAMYFFLVLGVYWGCKDYVYYLLITAPFMITGMVALGMGLEYVQAKFPPAGAACKAAAAAAAVLAPVWAWFACSSSDLRFQKWEDTVQYQFAQVMSRSEHPTLQVYGCWDKGFYNALDILPYGKYFTFMNFTREGLPEMYAEQDDIVRNQKVEYVICQKERIPSFIPEYYHEVSCWQESLILFKRNE